WRRDTQCELESECHRHLYCECEWYRHHDFDGGPSPPLRDRRWRKAAQVCGYRPHQRHRSRRFHGEAVAGSSSEAVRDQPSRFTVWRLFVSPYSGYGELKLMLWWDPLRGDPRFEKIVASLAPKEIAT